MTVMTYSTGGGERRRCDATCHRAHEPKCVCICGGRYHGKRTQAELTAAIDSYTREVLGCYPIELARAMSAALHNGLTPQKELFPA